MTTLFNRMLLVMRYVMPLFYLSVGLLLMFTKFFGDETGKFRLPLGIMLTGYSVFRVWRIIQDHNKPAENETSTDQ